MIVPSEIARLRESGVTIFSPEDGQKMGLVGMINSVVADCDIDLWSDRAVTVEQVLSGDRFAVARAITGAEEGRLDEAMLAEIRTAAARRVVPVLGITGTGGSGKSSLTDEVVRRFRTDQQDKLRIAVIAVDPTRRKGGGALLGDRIRANSLDGDRVFFRSLATRGAHEVPEPPRRRDRRDEGRRPRPRHRRDARHRPGRRRHRAARRPLALRDDAGVRRRLAAGEDRHARLRRHASRSTSSSAAAPRTRCATSAASWSATARRSASSPHEMPVFGTSAATFNDDGVTALYQHLRDELAGAGLEVHDGTLPHVDVRHSSGIRQVVPADRVRYLSEITETVRGYHARTDELAEAARQPPARPARRRPARRRRRRRRRRRCSRRPARTSRTRSPTRSTRWPAVVESYSGDEQVVVVRDREIHTKLTKESLSGNKIPRVSLPRFTDHGELVRFWRNENLPGYFPFTAGVFPFKRDNEDPARMFAGEGDPARTNRRFKILSEGNDATRLSTAFDSVTLYGRDPDPRPDVYGKVGTSGVSVATLDDMKALYDGFDLVSPTTSASP